MGMFDHVTFKGKLPNGKVGVTDQTKDFNCVMAHHVIDEDGAFWFDNGEWIETPKHEKPYPDAKLGTFGYLQVSMKWVEKLERDDDYTGTLWIDDYILHFFRGELKGFQHHETKVWTDLEKEKGWKEGDGS